jgi:thymidine phosphorylase
MSIASPLNLAFVQAANEAGVANTQLNGLLYAVYYNTMTLQDAIDFAVGMIKVTITIQIFTAGITTQPGAVAGVGGPTDVAVARPGKNISWIARKELHS